MTPLTFVAAIFSRVDFLAAFLTGKYTKDFASKDAARAAVIDYMRRDAESAWLLVYDGTITDTTLHEFAAAVLAQRKQAA